MKYSLLFFLTLPTIGVSQSSILDSIEQSLVTTRQTYIDSAFNYNDYTWYLANKFNSELQNSLIKHPSTFKHPFDSLQKQITIKTSPDSLLKIYSWYSTYGGSWHDIVSIAQFKTNKINTLKLSGGEGGTGECTDASYFKIQMIEQNSKKIYLVTGWGTHGSGYHHKIMRAFTITNNKLIELDSIFDGQKRLCVRTPRIINDIYLTYNEKTRTISYDLTNWNDKTKTFTTDKITIYWENNKFISNKK